MNTSIAVRDSARGASFFASFTRTLRVTSRCLLVLLLALLASSAWAASTTVVISQLYGGGGNSGATYNTKYVELFNLSASPQSLNGMSLQYGSKSGTTWSRFTLPNVSLAPGQYYLVQVGSGSSGSPLPVTPDTTTTSITPAAAGGKMVLMGDTSTFTGACPSGAVVDFIGYGTSASNQANCSEPITTPASANNVPDLSATTAAIRSNHGCTDTDNNAADFSVSVPSPHNSQTTANPCGGSTNPAVAAKSATPAPAGGSSTLSVTVTPGTNPASTGLSVTVDLTNIGGVNNFVLYDDGTHGDAVAGDNVFTATANVGASVTPNNYPLPITVRDFQLRTAAAVLINITVIPPPVAKTIMEIQGHGARSSFAGSGSVLGTTYVITPSGSNKNIVTAIGPKGFFMQDTAGDNDVTTSDGIYVYLGVPPTGLVVGDLVSVTGRVQEFSGSTEIAGGPAYTKVGHDDTAMPTPYDLTANPPNTDPGSGICTGTGTGIVVPSADGQTRNDGYQAANFACLDGMLVTMSHGMVNAPTYTVANSGITPSPATPNNGFFAVANTTRSFRKPGILGSDPNRTAYTTTFWGNPELIQVYYPGLNVDPSTLPVSPNMTGAGIYNGGQEITLTGVIQGYQASGSPDPTYELYPRTAADLQLIDAPTYPVAVPNPVAGKLRIGTQNALHFFNSSADGADTSQYTDTCAGTGVDDTCPTAAQYATRLSKLSSQIRNELKAPPVQVLQEVENYSVATNLAGQIAGDSGNAIQYRPYVIPGNDPGGINIAILVQNGVTVNSVSQLAKNTQSTAGCNPSFPTPCLLNDRPPVLLDATYQGYRFRVLAIYDKALSGLGTKAYVGPKRREQAEQVARIVQVLQTNGATLSGADVCTAQQNAAGTLDPTCALPITGSSSVPLIVLGDFNAYEFSDGYVDVTGTIMGTIDTSIRATDPNAANAVYVYPPSSAYVAPTPTLFDTGSTVTQAQHYSYNFGGLLQEIDHILLTAPGQNDFISLDSARGNSDISIASTTLTDSSTPQRTSDHDGQVVTLGYVVTPSTDANSTITSASALTVSKNAQPTFTITPAAGFMASVGGSCGSASPSSGTNPFTYTVNAILADCTVVVTSVALYNVTTTVSGVGGNISAPAVNPVASGASTTFTVTAASGYSVANVLGDHCTPTLQNAATNTWSTGTITQACAIAATFSANPVNGTCGSDNGKTLGAPPTNLCNAGMATALVGNGPWSWSCNGSNGGSNASCSANAAAGNALSVFGGANPISNGDNSPSMAKRTDYGPVPVGVGTTHGFTIANPAAVPAPGSVTPGAGATALAITAPALPAAVGDIVVSSIVSSNPAFTISGGTGTLAVGASIPFSITVTPTAPSTQNATITVTSNAAGTPVFTFAVTANAVIAGQATPAPMLTATMLLALMSLLAVIGHAVLRRRSVTK